jgi:hypothetical protein
MSKARLHLHAKWVLGFTLFCLSSASSGAAPNDSCAFPPGLDAKIVARVPGAHVSGLTDLDTYKKRLYKKDHRSRCPGLVKVKFSD